MSVTSEQIDETLESVRAIVCRDAAVAAEFEASRDEFFLSGLPVEATARRLAERRHSEWFTLERPSATLGGVPVETLIHAETEEELDEEALGALVSSHCGVFEVTGIKLGEGAWVRDLAALGEYALHEPEGSSALHVGDLLVGRMYPVGESLQRLSPAVAIFREKRLSVALARDFERARSTRRGVVRMSQAEIERMFHGPAADEQADALEAARAFFASNGLDAATIAALFAELERTPFDATQTVYGRGDALARILDRLAFETPVDLEPARRHLLAVWPRLSPMPAASAEAPARGGGDVHAAIAAFDRGRREGRDLEQLFRDLERDLELEDEGEAGDELLAPDFPGVVGAMVEEFRWEMRREHGDAAIERYEPLTLFAEFGQHIGVFDNLGSRELLWFTSVWLLDHNRLESAEQAHATLGALAEFCAWCEAAQDVPLATALAPHRATLDEALPRLVEANHWRASGRADEGELFEWLGGATRTLVRDRGGVEREARVPAELAARLRLGDRLRASLAADGELRVFCCYPAVSAELQSDPK